MYQPYWGLSQTPFSPTQVQGTQSQAGQVSTSSNVGSASNASGEPRDTPGEILKNRVRGYIASFLLVGVMIPVISSIILVALCFFYSISGKPQIGLVLLYALVGTILLWLVATVFCYRFAMVDLAKVDSYGLLIAHLCQLRAKLGLIKKDGDNEQKRLMEKCPEIEEAINKFLSSPSEKNAEWQTSHETSWKLPLGFPQSERRSRQVCRSAKKL